MLLAATLVPDLTCTMDGHGHVCSLPYAQGWLRTAFWRGSWHGRRGCGLECSLLYWRLDMVALRGGGDGERRLTSHPWARGFATWFASRTVRAVNEIHSASYSSLHPSIATWIAPVGTAAGCPPFQHTVAAKSTAIKRGRASSRAPRCDQVIDDAFIVICPRDSLLHLPRDSGKSWFSSPTTYVVITETK